MQGTWKAKFDKNDWIKDTKHKRVKKSKFIKDKSQRIFNRKHKLSKDKFIEIFNEDYYNFTRDKKDFKRTVIKEIDVFVVRAQFKKIRKYPEYDLTFEVYTDRYEDIYFDYKDKKFKFYFTKEPITGMVDFVKLKNGLIKIKGEVITSFKQEVVFVEYNDLYLGRYSRNSLPKLMYGEEVTPDFWNKNFNGSKRFCKKMANRKSRRKNKNFINSIENDTEVFNNSVERDHALGKSISWCVS